MTSPNVEINCEYIQVENTEDSVAVSGNFVNQTNIQVTIWQYIDCNFIYFYTQEAVQHFRINALQDPRTEELLKEFIRCKFI